MIFPETKAKVLKILEQFKRKICILIAFAILIGSQLKRIAGNLKRLADVRNRLKNLQHP
jgi:hypothetical protein